MPFLGQDWRSPGDQWVRSNEGWQKLDIVRKKMFANLLENSISRFQLKTLNTICPTHYMGICHDLESNLSQSYVHLKEVTNEQTLETPMAEALSKLDLHIALRDSRRCPYVLQLLQHLVDTKMSTMTGDAQKLVIAMIGNVVMRSVATRQDLRTTEHLLSTLGHALDKYYYNHVGSKILWDRHISTWNRLKNIFSSLQMDYSEDGCNSLQLTDLPQELISSIVCCLTDPIDLSNIFSLVNSEYEEAQWRQLCLNRFTNQQLVGVLKRCEKLNLIGWDIVYKRCIKRYGLGNVFADMLHVCRHCNILFWKKHGHPCPISNASLCSSPVLPQKFPDFFST